jgi:hypothetical protein
MTTPESYILPCLYSTDKSGNERIWKTYTLENFVYTTSGLVDGKKVTSKRDVEGVNIGKKNETSAEEQAMRVAETRWTEQISKGLKPKKKDKDGYKLYEKIQRMLEKSGNNINDARKKIRLEDDEEIVRITKKDKQFNHRVTKVNENYLPMLASKFDETAVGFKNTLKHLHLDNDWCYAQPKFDGNRAIIRLNGSSNEVAITSRNSKQYVFLKSLRDELKKFLKKCKKYDSSREYVLDGELYAHHLFDNPEDKTSELSWDERFQTLSKMCKTNMSNPNPMEDQLCYYVYDIIDEDLTYQERYGLLKNLFKLNDCSRIILCKTEKIYSVGDVYKKHNEYVAEGYEGIILRAKDLMYKQKHRSLKLRKYKNFDTEEFVIIDAIEGKGTEEGLVVWKCQDDDDNEFNVRPRGTFEERKQQMDNYEDYIGKLLTVRFQGKSKDGIPRFGIGIGIRDGT